MAILDIEHTPLWNEVQKILNQKNIPVLRSWKAVIHTPNEDIDALQVVSIDFLQDYAENIGDHVNIEFDLLGGDYIVGYYPFKDQAQISLYYTPLDMEGNPLSNSQPVLFERYKAVFLPHSNEHPTKVDRTERMSRVDLDRMGIYTVNCQLLNLSLEALRIVYASGVYSNMTYENIIRATLGNQSLKVLVSGKPSIDALNIVTPDNTASHKHTIIPTGVAISDVPTYIQEHLGGLYNAGLGTYLQRYNNRMTWFVYPLFNTHQFSKNTGKVMFYSIPSERFRGINKTWRTANNVLHILCADHKEFVGHGKAPLMNTGVGFRLAEAGAFMNKPVIMTPEGPKGSRSQLNYEVINEQMSDGVNYAPISKTRISVNPFKDYSDILRSSVNTLVLTWNHSAPHMLYPGMPVKYVYLTGNKLQSIEGVIIGVHTYEQMEAKGLASSRYIGTTFINILIDKTADINVS